MSTRRSSTSVTTSFVARNALIRSWARCKTCLAKLKSVNMGVAEEAARRAALDGMEHVSGALAHDRDNCLDLSSEVGIASNN